MTRGVGLCLYQRDHNIKSSASSYTKNMHGFYTRINACIGQQLRRGYDQTKNTMSPIYKNILRFIVGLSYVFRKVDLR